MPDPERFDAAHDPTFHADADPHPDPDPNFFTYEGEKTNVFKILNYFFSKILLNLSFVTQILVLSMGRDDRHGIRG